MNLRKKIFKSIPWPFLDLLNYYKILKFSIVTTNGAFSPQPINSDHCKPGLYNNV